MLKSKILLLFFFLINVLKTNLPNDFFYARFGIIERRVHRFGHIRLGDCGNW